MFETEVVYEADTTSTLVSANAQSVHNLKTLHPWSSSKKIISRRTNLPLLKCLLLLLLLWSMSINSEILCLCKKFQSPKKIIVKADYFLRKLNRKTGGSMGSADMLKYLICVDLAYRDYGLKWDNGIANTCGLKSNLYSNTFNKIQNKLNIAKNKTTSFQELVKKFKCSHIHATFDKIYKQYQTKTLNELTVIQRKYTNLATPTHKAAIFFVVATKHGKVKNIFS